MTPVRSVAVCVWVLFLPAATAIAFDSYDYARPDPGSYWQGSSQNPGYAPDARRGYSSEYRSQDSGQISPGYFSGDYNSGRDSGYDRNSNWYSDQRWSRQPEQALDQGADANFDPNFDPGYDQGPDQDAGQSSDWYSADWYDDQVLGKPGIDWQDNRQWSAPAPASQVAPGGWADNVAPPMQQRDGWGSERQSGLPRSKDAQTAPSYPASRYRDAYRDGYTARSDDTRAPTRTPRYRFRADPRLEERNVGGIEKRYRFRPLTAKELERRGGSMDADRFLPQSRSQRPAARPRGSEALGYDPGDTPENFYWRYDRGGP
jgi:hypothetical protein